MQNQGSDVKLSNADGVFHSIKVINL